MAQTSNPTLRIRSICIGSNSRRMPQFRAKPWTSSAIFFWLCFVRKSITLNWQLFAPNIVQELTLNCTRLSWLLVKAPGNGIHREVSRCKLLKQCWSLPDMAGKAYEESDETYVGYFHLFNEYSSEKSSSELDKLFQINLINSYLYFETIATINGKFSVSLQCTIVYLGF